jgi:alkylated DNA repair protein alkB family protein 6
MSAAVAAPAARDDDDDDGGGGDGVGGNGGGSGALGVRYYPDFLPPSEADALRHSVDAAKGWVELSGRRLLSLGGLVTPKGLVAAPLPAWVGRAVDASAARAGFDPSRPPNHALVNRYRPGEGILPHEDGPAYEPRVAILSLGSPAVLRFWRRRRRQGSGGDGGGGGGDPPPVPVPGVDPPDASWLLEDRSLVVFEGEAYAECWHGIEACENETIDASVVNAAAAAAAAGAGAEPGAAAGGVVPRRGDRVSFTIRRVERVRPLLQLSAKGA